MRKLTAKELLAKITANYNRSGGVDACWPWVGRWRTARGYGLVCVRGRSTTAHRALWLLRREIMGIGGHPGDGDPEVIRHKCDNPACGNPWHLEPGTGKDNARDATERGRRPHTRRRKLTDDQVRAIRKDTRTLKDIATEHGVSISVVSTIRNRKAKARVPDL